MQINSRHHPSPKPYQWSFPAQPANWMNWYQYNIKYCCMDAYLHQMHCKMIRMHCLAIGRWLSCDYPVQISLHPSNNGHYINSNSSKIMQIPEYGHYLIISRPFSFKIVALVTAPIRRLAIRRVWDTNSMVEMDSRELPWSSLSAIHDVRLAVPFFDPQWISAATGK